MKIFKTCLQVVLMYNNNLHLLIVQIVAPLHDLERGHWFCILIKTRTKVVEIWDSNSGKGYRNNFEFVVNKMVRDINICIHLMSSLLEIMK